MIKQAPEVQFKYFMLLFLITYYGSLVLPGILIVAYIYIFLIPFFLEVKSFIALFTETNSLIVLIFTPFIIIACYLLHLYLVALITRWFWQWTEKQSPSKEGIIPRGIPSKTLNYYHLRSFMIKYPKYIFIKGPFPWLANWMYNFIGTNEIGKGTTIEEQVCGDKFCVVGDNCYIGVNSVLTTHLVEGIFGRITYFKIHIGDNTTFPAMGAISPGGKLGENTILFPYASAFKYSELKGNNYYFGIPLRKIFKKKVLEYLDISEEDFNREKALRKKKQLSSEVISDD